MTDAEIERELAAVIPLCAWREYDRTVDKLDEAALRRALKREARLRGLYEIRAGERS